MTVDNTHEAVDRVTAEIEALRQAKPQLEEVLKAFSPFIIMRQRWLATPELRRQPWFADELRLAGGIPLIKQRDAVDDLLWEAAARFAVSSIHQGFPWFVEDTAKLAEMLATGQATATGLLAGQVFESESESGNPAPVDQMQPGAMRLFRNFGRRFMLSGARQDHESLLQRCSWSKGYCPLCGALPQVAVLDDQGRKLLVCLECSHSWYFSRLSCPGCEHEDAQASTVFFVDDTKDETAFVCSQCGRYLPTKRLSLALKQPNYDVVSLGLIHLDMILQEKGFLPMSEGIWNVLTASEEPAEQR
ncbi:formate dehydrogenase accessory protein FdhE [Desulfofustis limnaeus]|jgi:FdhE protein|uniref:Formate dehydrogenase accessory protein FdhE n=1 Tax=Desulfofustis limnaeus TaxID=2740163 RepID=A0ABM7WAN6_9BACT|nr:formate dehydrogenase accessory protein FdhE [Desulfofustis limnaeus]MDX9895612.1 formate dehydrogenase accessory protein FdhE [Desulfofustis sp.]BDD87974.1 hypothetical protein DPPLL_23390 [Desulfofustis limnaeus]